MKSSKRKSCGQASNHELSQERTRRTASVRETRDVRVASLSPNEAAQSVSGIKVKSRKKLKPCLNGPIESKSKSSDVLIQSIGLGDQRFLNGTVAQLTDACARRDGSIDEMQLNSIAAVIYAQKPKDHFEVMLIGQMCGVSALAMKYIGHLANADTYPNIETTERTLTKLTRTFVNQMEALQRYRSGGEKNVTVQNVSVNDGGQAMVGNFTQNAPDDGKTKAATTPPAVTDARSEPMPIVVQNEQPVTVPDKRRARQ